MPTLLEIKDKLKGYKNRDKTAEQMLDVIRNFPYLKIAKPAGPPTCAQEAMLIDKCLSLLGTVPVHISGHQYFIPVSILLPLDFPRSVPHVYIKPTPDMELVTTDMVNQFGRVQVNFLKFWNSKDSNLNDMVTILSIEFADTCPVQARSSQATMPTYTPSQSYNPAPTTQQYTSGSSDMSRSLQRSLHGDGRNNYGTNPSNQQPPNTGPYQPPNAGPYQPPPNTGPYQPLPARGGNLPPSQDSVYLQQQLDAEKAQHQRDLVDERARSERTLYDKQMLLNQAHDTVHREQQRANTLEERLRQTERELATTSDQLQAAQQGQRTAEERARAAQRGLIDKNEQQYWIVGKDEIKDDTKQLGTGGWATVRVARFRHMQVAAKYMHQLIISVYNRELFVREMNMAARMRHPNIVQFIGASMEGEAVILTELMSTSLRAQYAKQMLTYPQTITISEDVAKGLNYLHLIKPDAIIHRDISSANVLLEPLRDNKWRAKICDCGSANFAQLTNTAGPGNPTYAAPESDKPALQTTKMDVFSYGIVLLETNTQRFPDQRTRELLFDMLGHRQEMVGLIRWCTRHTPNDRPSIEEVLVELEKIDSNYKTR